MFTNMKWRRSLIMRMAQFHRHSTGLLHYMHVAYMLYTQVIIRTRSYVRVDVRMQLYIHAHTRLLLSSVVVVHSQKIARSACRIETANFVTYESLVANTILSFFFFFLFFFDERPNGTRCTWLEFIESLNHKFHVYHWSKLATNTHILWFWSSLSEQAMPSD